MVYSPRDRNPTLEVYKVELRVGKFSYHFIDFCKLVTKVNRIRTASLVKILTGTVGYKKTHSLEYFSTFSNSVLKLVKHVEFSN